MEGREDGLGRGAGNSYFLCCLVLPCSNYGSGRQLNGRGLLCKHEDLSPEPGCTHKKSSVACVSVTTMLWEAEMGRLMGLAGCQSSSRFRETLSQRNKAGSDKEQDIHCGAVDCARKRLSGFRNPSTRLRILSVSLLPIDSWPGTRDHTLHIGM